MRAAHEPWIVLVITDSEAHAARVRRLVAASAGSPVVVEWSGERAARASGEEPWLEPPSVVLLDLQLEGQGGLEALAALRADPHLAAAPVIVTVEWPSQREFLEACALPVAGYLVKPLASAPFHQLLADLGLARGEPPENPEPDAS